MLVEYTCRLAFRQCCLGRRAPSGFPMRIITEGIVPRMREEKQRRRPNWGMTGKPNPSMGNPV